MNCPNCNKPMTPATDAGQTVTVVHTCACGHKHTVSFANGNAPRKPASKIGHTLSTHFNYQPVSYVIIGQYRNRLGRTIYVCSEWNSASKRFLEISEDSYFMQNGKGKISTTAYPMNETHKAMSRAYRMMRLMKLVNRSVHRIFDDSVINTSAIAGQDNSGRWLGILGLVSDPEYLFGSPHVKAQRVTLRNKLIGMIQAELALAGITV